MMDLILLRSCACKAEKRSQDISKPFQNVPRYIQTFPNGSRMLSNASKVPQKASNTAARDLGSIFRASLWEYAFQTRVVHDVCSKVGNVTFHDCFQNHVPSISKTQCKYYSYEIRTDNLESLPCCLRMFYVCVVFSLWIKYFRKVSEGFGGSQIGCEGSSDQKNKACRQNACKALLRAVRSCREPTQIGSCAHTSLPPLHSPTTLLGWLLLA